MPEGPTFSEGAFSEGAFSEGAFSEGAFSEGAFSEGAFSEGVGDPPTVDRSSLASIYELHAAPMKRLAYLMTGSNAVAEDVVHDTFLRCSDRLGSVRDAGQYLRAAVVNACRDDWRRGRRLAPFPPDRGQEPPASADALAVRAALARMNPRQRAAVVLRFYGDFSHDQIAAVLDCQPATSRSLVARGLQQLKEELS